VGNVGSHDLAAVAWRIVSGSLDVQVRLAPNDDVRWRTDRADDPGWWEPVGARPGFRLDSHVLGGSLAAGWYELRGKLQLQRGNAVLPSLYLRYVSGSAVANTELILPEPDSQGCVSALLMFFDDVQSIIFHPSVSAAQFRMGDFGLRRVSRLRALRMMLGGPGNARAFGRLAAATAWVRAAASRGLKRATDSLYANYRQSVWPQGISEYDAWVRMYDTFGRTEYAAFARRSRALDGRGPLISVLVTAYNTPEQWLRRCLDSVLHQAYDNWELCVADGASTAPHVATVLSEYARRDRRVRVIYREHGGDIAAASNSALAMIHGGFVVLLDHDDELRPHALLRIAETVVAGPQLSLVYSDEDKIDADGKRFDPNFKPDWNPDLLRSQNYMCHLVAVRTSLVRKVGGFREGFERSQDYDLVLRCSEHLDARQIGHIPEVLYHWRAVADSTAFGRGAQAYSADAGARAVAEHLARTGVAAEIAPANRTPGLYRVYWPLPKPLPKISLVIPTRDRADLLKTCVESILAKSTYPDYELVVVDNRSSDPEALDYLSALRRRERVRVLSFDAPFNYSAINNWAAARCDGALLTLVNNDIELITNDWLEEMAGIAMRPDIGAVGAMLYYPDNTIQHAGVVLGVLGVAGHIDCGMPRGYEGHGYRALVAQNLSAVTGACLMVRRRVFDEVDGLDEDLPVSFNDIDFCLRVRAHGYRNAWTPFAELYHHESASRGREDTPEKLSRYAAEVAFMQKRWGEALLEDPAYNPNLSLQSHNCQLAFPPRCTRDG
jgi:GT2 family glycosyltransferase